MPISPIDWHDVLIATGLALPWIVVPLVAVARQRRTVTLDDFSATPVENSIAPRVERVSIVLPARNEAAHIASCVRTLRETSWPDVEIIVVNDHSDDDTAALAIAAADGDPRVQVIDAPDLPSGWFGKQWACHTGAQRASGSLLLFTDADTRHAPDLIPRVVRARAARQADLLSVAGNQEMVSFWERTIQPAVFIILLTRFGGTREIETAKHPADVIANGQCFMMPRASYDAVGGHAAVRDTVAEDLMMAQRTHRLGLRVSLVLGVNQLSTRMYDDFRSVVRGWMKNVYAGGRMAMRGGALGRAVYPVALVGGPIFIVLPVLIAIGLAIAFVSGNTISSVATLWSAIAGASLLAFFARMNILSRAPLYRALLTPLGMLMFAAIGLASVIRGQRVTWKNRTYQSS
ncbi:MAG: glycosyltransferase [Gemmatimonas sp.]